jgi:DNA mismatch repair ATPase MutS
MLPKEHYSLNIGKYTEILKLLRQRSAFISVFRLLVFAAVVCCIYLLVKHFSSIIVAAIILLSVLFIVLVRISLTLSAKRNLTRELLFVNKNELNILAGKENEFPSHAIVHDPAMHTYDLDIFGTRSIFHLLNRTTTTYGNKVLSQMLNEPILDEYTIKEQQEAIKVFSPQMETRQLITAHGLVEKEKEGKIEDVITWIKSTEKLSNKKWLNILRLILPVFNIISFIYYLDTDNLIPVSIGILACWLLVGIHFKYINDQHTLTGKKTTILQQYALILKHFYTADPGQSKMIMQLQNTAKNAHHEIFRLSKLMNLLDQRLNLLVNFILNSFFLYDLQCIIALEKWKTKNSTDFISWIQTVGKIEALNSLSAFAFNNPDYCYAEIIKDKPQILATQMAHPLISRNEQVANDIAAGINEKLLLITGSNMSGKSTFLRTLGVNLLLAQCGAPVCATTFKFTPLQILSSIRISDSLQDNTSYFMAELKRLREIITQLETGIPALVLIDEVLRGTNSDDKTHGSESLIIKLLKYNCLSLFASHDLSLSTLENTHQDKISNYCFESTITNGELLFDYRLHAGVATNKNASFLMEKMGII